MKNSFTILLILFISFLFPSCKTPYTRPVYPSVTVCFNLPSWPPDDRLPWPELSAWQISISSSEDRKTFSLAPETESFRLQTTRKEVISVSAKPILKSSMGDYIFFHEAGTVWPHESHENQLTWEGGISAYTAARIYETVSIPDRSDALLFLQHFNWSKFTKTVAQKQLAAYSESNGYNPWNCNFQKIINGICQKNFSSAKLTSPSLIQISMDNISGNSCFYFSPYIPENNLLASEKSLYIPSHLENETSNFPFLSSDEYLILFTAAETNTKNYSIHEQILPILK